MHTITYFIQLLLHPKSWGGAGDVSLSQRGNLSLREVEVNVQGHTAAKGLSGIYTQVRLLLRSLGASHASQC